jgi:tRNA nucleotidyltransferase/poly(A) polymerase
MGLEAYAVGGYVRDYYLHRPSSDIDVVVVGSGVDVAEALAKELGGAKVAVYKTYGTAMVRWRDVEVEFVVEQTVSSDVVFGKTEGHDTMFVDADGDGAADYMVVDVNDDGEAGYDEIHDVSDEGIMMSDLG